MTAIIFFTRSGPYRNHDPQPLYYAASYGLKATVEALVSQGAQLDVQAGGYGGTGLHAACFRRHPNIVRMLLKAGSDPSIEDSDEMSSIDLTIWSGYPDVAEVVLEEVPSTKLGNILNKRLQDLSCGRVNPNPTGEFRRRRNPYTGASISSEAPTAGIGSVSSQSGGPI